MHKDLPVAELEISEYSGQIDKIEAVHAPSHLPLGTTISSGKEKGRVERGLLNDWWRGRSIPASRAGIDSALQNIGVSTPALLLEKCYGLSLSDHYWICPKGSGLRWENVNFFTNGFSKDMGEILFGREPDDPSRVSLMSPDNTSDGWLRKKWIVADGKRVLMKGGSGDYSQEPYNEVIASEIMRRLDINHVPYTLMTENGKPYCLCETFATPKIELIPAICVIESMKKSNRDSAFAHLLRCCDELGIPGVERAIGKMLTVDCIIANEDRHYGNFGFVRNSETLEWLGFAPVYDSGTSLWYSTARIGRSVESRPFKKSHAEQMALVTDLKWFNFDALKGIDDAVRDILSGSDDIDASRCDAIAKSVLERAWQIEQR
ncbi:MAG: HipA domain-containing protein [Oscillospiraceae bacterium]|nr:HipA domain-containing protein [Oscillospiraceae bacterium]